MTPNLLSGLFKFASSPVPFPSVYIRIEHGVALAPVLTTSRVNAIIPLKSWVRIYSIDHFVSPGGKIIPMNPLLQ